MYTANQIVAHLVGDYILQSDWMVRNKGRQSVAAAVHSVFYAVPFLFLTQSPVTLAIIIGTHFVIDRWRAARFVIWLKNWPFPDSRPWEECRKTGYPADTPPWLAGWLLILVDNTLHILINGAAIYYFG